VRPAQAAAAPAPALLVCLPTSASAPAYCDAHLLCTQYAGYATAHGYNVSCPP